MEIIDIINLIDFSEEEKNKVDKFLASLANISKKDAEDIIKYLNSKNIRITKAKDLKVLANSLAEISKNVDILESKGVGDIYINNPGLLNYNVMTIYRRIAYCIQKGINYKNEEGMYNDFIFDTKKWNTLLDERENNLVENNHDDLDITTVEPPKNDVENNEMNFSDSNINNNVLNSDVELNNVNENINNSQNIENDLQQMEEKQRYFEGIREDLKNQLASLNDFNDLVGIDDLDENIGMGRAA